MDAFPAFFPLEGRTVVVVGGGEAAAAKARLFEGSPAVVRRVAEADAERTELYADAALVFVALTGQVGSRAAAAARRAGVLVNVVDQPALCDFTTPAIVDRGAVVGAIGTGGAAPVLATLLRGELEASWPEDLGARAALAAGLRDEVRAALPELRARRRFLRALLSGPAMDDAEARRRLASFAEAAGEHVEIAAGGPAERLRLSDVRALAQADLVVAEPGCDPAVLAFARRDAERVEGIDEAVVAVRVAAGDLVVVCRGAPTP